MKIRKQKFRAFHKVDGFKYFGDMMSFMTMDGIWKVEETEPIRIDFIARDCGYTFTEYTGRTDIKGKRHL